MSDLIIQKESLTKLADAIRNNIAGPLSGIRIESGFILSEEEGTLQPGVFKDYFRIYKDGDPVDYEDDKEYTHFSYEYDEEGNLVPVVYETCTNPDDPHYGIRNPGTDNEYWYRGRMEFDGRSWDVWKMISWTLDGPDPVVDDTVVLTKPITDFTIPFTSFGEAIEMVASSNRSEGFAEGKKSEYDEFWDALQQNGNRENYAQAFSYLNWRKSNFKPKYKIYPVNANYMFYSCQTDLKDLRDFDIDFSRCTAFGSCFCYAWINHIGVIDTRATSGVGTLFQYHTALQSVDKFILRNDGSQKFTDTFTWTSGLTHIIFEGVIGQNGINFQHSTKLDKESITSIMNALSTTTSGLTVTLSQTAVNNAFTTDEWNALRATKSNWTIALA